MKCPWDRLVESILNKDDANALEWIIGAIVLNKIDMKKVVVLSGPPRSGKTTLLRIINRTLGYDHPVPVLYNVPTAIRLDKFSIVETNLPSDRLIIPKDIELLTMQAHGNEDGRKLSPKDYIRCTNQLEYEHWHVLNKCLKTYMEFGENYI